MSGIAKGLWALLLDRLQLGLGDVADVAQAGDLGIALGDRLAGGDREWLDAHVRIALDVQLEHQGREGAAVVAFGVGQGASLGDELVLDFALYLRGAVGGFACVLNLEGAEGVLGEAHPTTPQPIRAASYSSRAISASEKVPPSAMA